MLACCFLGFVLILRDARRHGALGWRRALALLLTSAGGAAAFGLPALAWPCAVLGVLVPLERRAAGRPLLAFRPSPAAVALAAGGAADRRGPRAQRRVSRQRRGGRIRDDSRPGGQLQRAAVTARGVRRVARVGLSLSAQVARASLLVDSRLRDRCCSVRARMVLAPAGARPAVGRDRRSADLSRGAAGHPRLQQRQGARDRRSGAHAHRGARPSGEPAYRGACHPAPATGMDGGRARVHRGHGGFNRSGPSDGGPAAS